MEDKDISVVISIMIISALRFIDKPTPKVSNGRRTIIKGLKKEFLKKTGSDVRKASDEYNKLNLMVMDSWDKTRRELVDPDTQMKSAMSEIITVLWERMGSNPYQTRYIGKSKMYGVINSIEGCLSSRGMTKLEEDETLNNSRALANRFLELCKIPKRHNLATRLAIQKQNLIIEKG